MLSRNYEFYLVTTNYWPYGLPYNPYAEGKLKNLLSLSNNYVYYIPTFNFYE